MLQGQPPTSEAVEFAGRDLWLSHLSGDGAEVNSLEGLSHMIHGRTRSCPALRTSYLPITLELPGDPM